MMVGLFIAFEGLDGAGKTTQVNLAAQWLRNRGIAVVTTTDPNGTEYGRRLYEAMSAEQPCDAAKLLSFAAARAELVRRVVLPAIAARKVVLCDRWIPSTIAYQGFGSGLSVSSIRQANAIALNGLALPSKTIWLDLTPEQSLARTKARGVDAFERRYTPEFLARVRAGYQAQSENPDWVRMDASRLSSEVAEKVQVSLEDFLDLNAFLQFA